MMFEMQRTYLLSIASKFTIEMYFHDSITYMQSFTVCGIYTLIHSFSRDQDETSPLKISQIRCSVFLQWNEHITIWYTTEFIKQWNVEENISGTPPLWNAFYEKVMFTKASIITHDIRLATILKISNRSGRVCVMNIWLHKGIRVSWTFQLHPR